MNSKGEILCHQRSLNKERMPGVWSTHLGGHVSSTESYEENAHKELQEESGIDIDPSSLVAWRTTKIEQSHLWVREYVVVVDKDVNELIPQPGEVEKFAWLSPAEIMASVKEEPTKWWPTTAHFMQDYHCLRAAITAAASNAKFTCPVDLHTWHAMHV